MAAGELLRLWYAIRPAPDCVVVEIIPRLKARPAGSMHPFPITDVSSARQVGMVIFLNNDAPDLDTADVQFYKPPVNLGIAGL